MQSIQEFISYALATRPLIAEFGIMLFCIGVPTTIMGYIAVATSGLFSPAEDQRVQKASVGGVVLASGFLGVVVGGVVLSVLYLSANRGSFLGYGLVGCFVLLAIGGGGTVIFTIYKRE